MTSPEEVREALRATADTAQDLDADAVWSRVSTGIGRRRRRRQALGVAGAALAVVALALGTQALDAPGRTPPPRPAAVTAGPSPSPAPALSSTPPPSSPSSPPPASPVPLADVALPHTPEQARRAFTAAGYDDADAKQLGQVWRWGLVDEVEVVAGLQLLRGRPLPLRPGQGAAAAPPGQPALFRTKAAYAGAGYDDADAAALAARWGERSADLVEVFVGQLVLDGDLPTAGPPRSSLPG